MRSGSCTLCAAAHGALLNTAFLQSGRLQHLRRTWGSVATFARLRVSGRNLARGVIVISTGTDHDNKPSRASGNSGWSANSRREIQTRQPIAIERYGFITNPLASRFLRVSSDIDLTASLRVVGPVRLRSSCLRYSAVPLKSRAHRARSSRTSILSVLTLDIESPRHATTRCSSAADHENPT
jgi:hypothetical protein